MNEIDFGLKKTIDTTCGLKEMNDNVTKVEVICDDDIAGRPVTSSLQNRVCMHGMLYY